MSTLRPEIFTLCSIFGRIPGFEPELQRPQPGVLPMSFTHPFPIFSDLTLSGQKSDYLRVVFAPLHQPSLPHSTQWLSPLPPAPPSDLPPLGTLCATPDPPCPNCHFSWICRLCLLLIIILMPISKLQLPDNVSSMTSRFHTFLFSLIMLQLLHRS